VLIIKNGIYNIIGSSVRLVLNLLTIPTLIYLVGIEEYGLWTLLFTIVSISMIAEGGLSSSTTLFVSKYLNEDSSDELSMVLTVTSVSVLVLALFVVFFLFLLSPFVSSFLPHLSLSNESIISSSVRFSGIVVGLKILQGIPMGIQAASENYKFINTIVTAQAIFLNIGMILIAYFGGKTLSFLQWHIVVNALTFLICILFTAPFLSKKKIRFIFKNPKYGEILRYSFWVWLTSLGTAIFQQGDKIVIATILSPRELGAYGVITSTVSQINSFSATAVQPLLPMLGSLLHDSSASFESIQKQIKQSSQLNAFIVFIVGGALIAFESIVTNFFFHQNNLFEYKLSFLIAVSIYSIYSINAVGYFVLLALQESKNSMTVTILSGVVSVVLILIGARVFGLPGAIAGNIGFVGTLLLTFDAMRKLRIPCQFLIKWLFIPFTSTLVLLFVKLLCVSCVSYWYFQEIIMFLVHATILVLWFSSENVSLTKALSIKISKLYSK
jgi:O-antigen/teichoic acid export membrane protein